jgi:SAM-dependent methyltransferase
MSGAASEYLGPYRAAVDRFGPGFEATLWGSREAQRLRFDVMIDLAGFEGCVVVDAGCGQGDLARRLHERSVAFARYVGIDAIPEMIAAARRLELPRCSFVAGDVLADRSLLALPGPDWVCISGTLNTMDEPSARRLVEDALDAAAQGVVFNFLSSRPHPRWENVDLGAAHRFDALRWLDFALRLSSCVVFTQAYLDGHDATIMVQHD